MRRVKQNDIDIIRTPRTDFPNYDNLFKFGHDIYMTEWVVLDKLFPIILYHRKGNILEIGMGDSTFFCCKYAMEYEVKAISCDINQDKLIKYFYDHKVFYGKSEDLIKIWDEEYGDEDLAIVLIDGCHDYTVAKMEFDFFWPRVIEGGCVFIHDTYPPQDNLANEPTNCGDVWRLRQDLEKRQDEMDCFTWPYTAKWMGLTMCMKKEAVRPEYGK